MPGLRDSIEQVAVTRSGVLVALYSNVKGRLLRLQFDEQDMDRNQHALPANGSVGIATANENSDTAFATYEDFLTPATLYRVAVATLAATPIKSLRRSSLPRISRWSSWRPLPGRNPRAVLRGAAEEFVTNGAAPTLLYGYGGSTYQCCPVIWARQENCGSSTAASRLANFAAVASFGPAWHEAGLKTHRQVVYDDFIAVAQDLIERRISSARRLGIEGGSNGGLLMGVVLSQRPELFHAAVIQVPLLDMLRFDKLLAGASWVDEYGSPQVPQERAWLEKMSPYQNLHFRQDFPQVFLLTSLPRMTGCIRDMRASTRPASRHCTCRFCTTRTSRADTRRRRSTRARAAPGAGVRLSVAASD